MRLDDHALEPGDTAVLGFAILTWPLLVGLIVYYRLRYGVWLHNIVGDAIEAHNGGESDAA
jgi:hypothetical protein